MDPPPMLLPGAEPLVAPVAVPGEGVLLSEDDAVEGVAVDGPEAIELVLLPAGADDALIRRSRAFTRSAAAERSWRRRASSLLMSAPPAVPPLNVPLPDTALLPAAGTELDEVVPDELVVLGVSAPALEAGGALGVGEALGVGDAEGGVLSAVDAAGTLGSPAVVLVVDVVVSLLAGGAVVTGLGGASTFVSLLHAATEAPIAAATNSLRVTIACSCSR